MDIAAASWALLGEVLGSMASGVSGLSAAADVACFGAVAHRYESLELDEEKGPGKVLADLSK
eukprot:10226743-Lingulodinium_polyedra.AAC.1